jgi:3-hydroxymyristoyl/3-hydroxydecanoyl-(acyl carrier protein) dehydratase
VNIAALIEVRAPYFALSNLRATSPGTVIATVQSEQPRGHELGGLAAAEAGRHLAIAGSCACASLDPGAGKRFYLANRATLRRLSQAASVEGPLVVEATAVSRDKRKAQAQATISDALGRVIFALDVGYMVLEERVFQRMFAGHRRDLRTGERAAEGIFDHLRRNPYQKPLPLVPSELDREHGVALLPELQGELCAGHFPLYPAMPVALLMYGLSTLSGEVLRARYGAQHRYFVQGGSVQADNLAFAGESLRFEAHWRGSEAGDDSFEARAVMQNGAVAGSMELSLRRVDQARVDEIDTLQVRH